MPPLNVGIIGGTGAQGRGLALRFLLAGHHVTVGSRRPDRAQEVATELRHKLPQSHRPHLDGANNSTAASANEVVVLATPWSDEPESWSWLAPLTEGKVVISCLNPLGFDKTGPYRLHVSAGSAAEHIAHELPAARVASAFHHLAAPRLADTTDDLADEDVLIATDDRGALRVASRLSRAVSARDGIDAGPLRLSRELEAWTAVLISVNKQHRTHAGIALRNVDPLRSRRLAP